jgi:uncharacterized protein YfaQ (DUF2300 family)
MIDWNTTRIVRIDCSETYWRTWSLPHDNRQEIEIGTGGVARAGYRIYPGHHGKTVVARCRDACVGPFPGFVAGGPVGFLDGASIAL